MKFALASDLHLAFGSIVINNKEGADVLVLAGDIFEAADLPDIEYHYVRDFFRNISNEFKHVLWVAGNHEHYGLNLVSTPNIINAWLHDDLELGNVHYLERESIFLEGVWFHGTTLWTDLNKNNPLDCMRLRDRDTGMCDFEYIEGLTTQLWYNTHCASIMWLGNVLEQKKGEKNVVITHHHPSSMSLDPQFIGDPMNAGYYSELSEFIMDRPAIKYWCAGHMHRRFRYQLEDTWVVCNPRGYHGREPMTKTFKLDYYEV